MPCSRLLSTTTRDKCQCCREGKVHVAADGMGGWASYSEVHTFTSSHQDKNTFHFCCETFWNNVNNCFMRKFRIRVSGCCLCPHMSDSHRPILAEADEGAPDSHICPCSRHHGISRSRSGGFNTVASGANFHHLYCDPYHKDLRSGGPGPTDNCPIQGSEPGLAHKWHGRCLYIKLPLPLKSSAVVPITPFLFP
jgi:hypothetical protein